MIGFAETTTALGHGVYDVIEGASYIHTTREQLLDLDPSLVFEEEHSHATDQLCYADDALLRTDRPIVLVDDEVTTGRTNMNIIRDLHAKHPRSSYTILSILDWRTEEHEEAMLQLQEELGVNITSLSLLKGQMMFRGQRWMSLLIRMKLLRKRKDLNSLFILFNPSLSKCHIHFPMQSIRRGIRRISMKQVVSV